jgi:hypothetical protein
MTKVKADKPAMLKRTSLFGLIIGLALIMNACATFKKPATIDELPIRERALIKEMNGVRTSTALVGDEEAKRLFGIDLARQKIQAVWLSIENNTDRSLLLLPTAIDPNYFSPLEVAFTYHASFSGDVNATLDAYLHDLNFPVRERIRPGARASGYIFTNWSKRMKVVDVDLLGNGVSHNFTFFVPHPESSSGQDVLARMDAMFAEYELVTVDGEAELRHALERLPCCMSGKDGASSAGPLNVVIIGKLDDWTTAFVRRGYRYQPLAPGYVFGRVQDLSVNKLNHGGIRAQAHTVRFWQTPIRYLGKPVWVGQTTTRRGGRFAEKAPLEATFPIEPYVDEARNDLTQDLAYSQALIKFGHVKGAGKQPAPEAGKASAGIDYITDGLRVVLAFGDRPASLASIDFFDWERLADYR